MMTEGSLNSEGMFSGPDAPDEQDMYKCVHCGFCLQACPTYMETGLETESPRGRIALMKAVNEGRVGLTERVFRHWDLCIQCRACETACPSGVPYGRLIEATTVQVERHRKRGFLPRLVTNTFLNKILPYQDRLGILATGLRLYERSGAQWAVRTTRALRLLSGRLADLEESAPSVSGAPFKAMGQVIPAQGQSRARVALLAGCIMPLVNGPEMNSLVRVLSRNGCDVVVPKEQGCCGAIHSHVGDLDTARRMARQNIDAFADSEIDAVIVASAGCGARMKEYDDLLCRDDAYGLRSKRFVPFVKDVHEFLADLPLIPPTGRLDRKVTYQDSCHLVNAQGITDAPRHLLNSIPGLELVEMNDPSRCCGAGGTYAITQRDFSLRILNSKMSDVEATGTTTVATANPGCLIQLQLGSRRSDKAIHPCYVTDLLDESYGLESGTLGKL